MQKYFDQVSTHLSNFDQYDEDANSFYEEDAFLGMGKKAKRKRVLKKQRGEAQFARDKAMIALEQRATEKMLQPEVIALQDVIDNKPLIASYVSNAGQVPQKNPAALALQATEVFQNKVEQRQASGVPDYEQASIAEMNDITDDWNNDNGDEFFGAIATSVFKAGNTLVEKINEKRQGNGKKPLFSGKNWKKLAQKYKDNSGVVDEAINANERAFLAMTVKENEKVNSPLIAAKNSIVNYQTQQAIRQYLPWALVVLIIVFFVGKKS